MEYLQKALARIIPDYEQIAEEAACSEAFATLLFCQQPFDRGQCIVLPPGPARRVAFLAERRDGRRRQVEWMEVEEDRPSAVMANYFGHISYVPASEFYYQDYSRLRLGLAAAARGSARLSNRELLMLLCRAGLRVDAPHMSPAAILELLLAGLREDGFRATSLVVPAEIAPDELGLCCALEPCPPSGSERLLGRLGPGINVWGLPGLRRVVAIDSGRVGISTAGPLKVLMGAHNRRNAYWFVAGRYLNAVVETPRAIRWAYLPYTR